MQILYLPPDQDGYRLIEPTDRVLRTRLAGGATRSRLDQAESWKQATVTWTVNRSEYLMLTSFFETATEGGVNHFLCELITDSPVGKLHECHFLPGSRDLGNTQGHTYQFVGELAVRPQRIDHELNRVRLKRYEQDRCVDLLNIEIKDVTPNDYDLLNENYLVGHEYCLELSLLFDNPDCLDIRYEVENLPDRLRLDPLTGTVKGELLDGCDNIYDHTDPNITPNFFIVETGSGANTLYQTTDFLPITPGLVYQFLPDARFITFYDSDLNLIPGVGSDRPASDEIETFIGPENAAFIRLSILQNNGFPERFCFTQSDFRPSTESNLGERIVIVNANYRGGKVATSQFEMNIRPADAVGIAGHSIIPPMRIGSTFRVG